MEFELDNLFDEDFCDFSQEEQEKQQDYLEQQMLEEKTFLDNIKRIMKPSKFNRLMKDLDLFGDDNTYGMCQISTKKPNYPLNQDDYVKFKGFSPRGDCWAVGDCGDSFHGSLFLRITKSQWLEIWWSC